MLTMFNFIKYIIFILCTITNYNLTYGRIGSFNQFKRLYSGLLSEGLPMWLEKRVEFNTPYDYDSISMAIKDRSNFELDELNRIISQSNMNYPLMGYFDTKLNPSIYSDDILVREMRDKPAIETVNGLSTNGLRSYINWQPAVVGSVCAALGVLVIAALGTVYQKRKLRMQSSLSQDEEFILENSNLPDKMLSLSSEDDRKLAQSAQMYHYQHQKQQMLALEKVNDHARTSDEDDSEDDVDEGDFTVYECPGLANTGEIEVENPLFDNNPEEKALNTSGSSGELIGCSDLDEHIIDPNNNRYSDDFHNLRVDATSRGDVTTTTSTESIQSTTSRTISK
ncbi:Neural proliferation differentiation and control protein 1 [Schistosoma japonicum]|nr:Neural proliferation differentiation and control protein 1 [Schistosoma japonicum]KAH8867644.1 Neural proliferation differentiation and control protein 1 [Schistosoma japonicum]KAH8867645.1 Neural proliferation differentiation and control protein 1 [Schistosoma japonicum]KAH8867646.1 Neural proliferation differentiation and control protein 1 [Schistosoma japonicum]KAH8867647.1 Neural proliferation differentiation and control protein 1 [Schistosoma japonicum]